ncbi:MAG: hypothetical protein EXR74_00440 [Bdellovibrionales bacterium]|nr:hypothetical protein [Bdellovibrionales bacterium]
MIVIHSWSYVVTPEDLILYQYSLSLKIGNVLHFLCFSNIWIPAIAGASLRLQSNVDTHPKGPQNTLSRISFKWGVVLLIAGMIFSARTNHSELINAYNPLHFLGVSFVLISILLVFSPLRCMWVWTSFVFVASIINQYFKPHLFLEPLSSPELLRALNWVSQMKLMLLEITLGSKIVAWSLLPWFTSILVGFLFADKYDKNRLNISFLKKTIVISFAIVVFGFLDPKSTKFIGEQNILDQYHSLYMPMSLFVSVIAGFVLAISLATLWYQKESHYFSDLIMALSRGSFWIFMIHFSFLSLLSPTFEFAAIQTRIFFFPAFVLLWCVVFGTIIVELGKKKLVINFVKKRQSS